MVPWRHALKNLLDFNQRAVDSYVQAANNWGGENIFTLITTVIKTYLAKQQVTIHCLLTRPDQIVEPRLYLNLQKGTLPVPYLKVELNGFMVPKSAVTTPISRSVWDVRLEDNVFSTRFVTVLPGIKDDDMLQAETLMSATDLAFCEHSVPPEVYTFIRRDLEKLAQKRVLQIV